MAERSAEIVFRTERPMHLREMVQLIHSCLHHGARDIVVSQGTEIKIVCIVPDTGPATYDLPGILAVISVEAEPLDGKRH